MAYRLLDHTADLGFVATAASLPDLFDESLRALTDCLTRLEAVEPIEHRIVRLSAPEPAQLLVGFLEEAVYLYETEGLVFARAEVSLFENDTEWRLEAELRGEVFDLERHGLKTLIKAVTYHQLEVREVDGEWAARVILDI